VTYLFCIVLTISVIKFDVAENVLIEVGHFMAFCCHLLAVAFHLLLISLSGCQRGNK